ncbi:cytosine permease [Streptomyces sp. NPDC014646]|uniref:cytosine permease n=1 Tax=Streptomyces sp. NPDC014646 TaxID=3364877 RepID=UPI0036F772BD
METRGLEPVPDSERTGRVRALFPTRVGANPTVLSLTIGAGLVVFGGLNLRQVLTVALVTPAIGFGPVGPISLAGRSGGAPGMALSRAASGRAAIRCPARRSGSPAGPGRLLPVPARGDVRGVDRGLRRGPVARARVRPGGAPGHRPGRRLPVHRRILRNGGGRVGRGAGGGLLPTGMEWPSDPLAGTWAGRHGLGRAATITVSGALHAVLPRPVAGRAGAPRNDTPLHF